MISERHPGETTDSRRAGTAGRRDRLGGIGGWCYDQRRAVLAGWIGGLIAVIACVCDRVSL
jgi:hypothetical protein